MKKLEKMDGKLFESLKPNEMSNLSAFVGGWTAETCVDNKEDTYKQATDPFKGDEMTDDKKDIIFTTISSDGFVEGNEKGDPLPNYDKGM
jgi:hypothetical protein